MVNVTEFDYGVFNVCYLLSVNITYVVNSPCAIYEFFKNKCY